MPNFILRYKAQFYLYLNLLTQNPLYFLVIIFSRFDSIRNKIILFFLKKPSFDRYSENNSLFANTNTEIVVKSLEKEGLYLGINLPTEIKQEIWQYVDQTDCLGDKNSLFPFLYQNRKQAEQQHQKLFAIGEYLNIDANCPGFNKLRKDPKLLSIAARYLQCKPVYLGSRLWWTFANDLPLLERLRFGQQLFHYDLIDFRAIKFYFYLTDVDINSGPHVCIRGSHKQKRFFHQCSLFAGRSQEEMVCVYGKDRIIAINGKSGFGFAEDPYCFHKGTTPNDLDRLILQIEFGLNSYSLDRSLILNENKNNY